MNRFHRRLLITCGAFALSMADRHSSLAQDCRPNFVPESRYEVGTQPGRQIEGDFNGDQKLDLAVTHQFTNRVTILLGNGTSVGTFSQPPAHTYTLTEGPRGIACADLDLDGDRDLITTFADGTTAVLRGNGDGSFSALLPGDRYTVGANAISVVVANFNGDTWPDLAVADYWGTRVSILLGYGGGSFLSPQPYTVAGAWDVGVADFDRDGYLDFVASSDGAGHISVYFGDGTGQFTFGAHYTSTASVRALAVGDFNGDNNPDVACAEPYTPTISVHIGNGTRVNTFRPAVRAADFVTPSNPTDVVIRDLDGDGKDDIIASLEGNTALFFKGNGDAAGTFQSPNPPFQIGDEPTSLTVSDFTGDGRLDIVTTNDNSSTISLLRNLSTLPSILLQPASRLVRSGASVSFSISVGGTGPFVYEWRRNGSSLMDGGSISGATTATLTIDPAVASDAGDYVCVVSNACGTVESNAANLAVTDCLGDLNHDGVFDGRDVQWLVNALVQRKACPE